jgi:hypothetical protein
MSQSKLWVFGDSFSVPFSKHFSSYNDWSHSYKNYKNGITPKIFCEIISDKLNYQLINHSIGGCSNSTIFSNFINNLQKIENHDILIFGWTANSRYRLANNFNSLVDITYALKHPSPNEFVSQKSLIEYSINRSNNSVFLTEIMDYIKIINFSLKNNKIIHWTWVSPDSHELELNGKFEKKNYEGKILLVSQFTNLRENMKKYICDFGGEFLYNGHDLKYKDFEENGKIYEFIKQKKCIVIINIENTPKLNEYISSKYDVIDIHNNDDYIQNYYEMLIPFKKYETIKDETNGIIDDLHYSENGHINMSFDMLNFI